MSLYDKSSLLQVPSLYKDGTLVSTIPEDRSGDFTVVRGSNLSATRIGPDGYIKKGYENLLLQSNQFDTTWSQVGSFNILGGQQGYDSSNNAWSIESNSTAFDRRIQQSLSLSGVHTFSVYAKSNSTDWILFYNGTDRVYFDLANGVVGSSQSGLIIDSKIEPTSVTGWYRCTATFNRGISFISVVPASGDGNSNVLAGNSIYIQDAQLNQGLVAYPYLETTTAPAQGGLLENTPRLDWSNGVPSVLVEEGRTNRIRNSEYVDWSNVNVSLDRNYGISPEGVKNSLKVTSVTSLSRLQTSISLPANIDFTFSLFIKNIDATESRIYGVIDTIQYDIFWNGAEISSVTTGLNYESFSNGWYRVWETSQSDTSSQFRIYPERGANVGSIEIYGLQLEEASYPTSYIPTYGTSQTRSNEVISDNFNIPTTATIYNSFYSDVAETVFVFDQVFNVVEGLNKVAIAFSPTAVKISVGGSIVANATGTYDTTSLTNIQLGSNNGTDYSNAPISGFYVFPEFLTDEELNSLTD